MITIICGTNRKNSKTLAVSGIYKNILAAKNTESCIFSMEQLPGTFSASHLDKEKSHAFRELLEKYILPSRKMIFVIPEYNGSFPGILKTFIDGCPPSAFHYKKAALTGISDGRAGNLRGLDHLTSILNHLRVEVLSAKPKISDIEKELNEAGNGFHNPEITKTIERQIDSFLTF